PLSNARLHIPIAPASKNDPMSKNSSKRNKVPAMKSSRFSFKRELNISRYTYGGMLSATVEEAISGITKTITKRATANKEKIIVAIRSRMKGTAITMFLVHVP
ncbi:MAG TPA: hypothetical protein PKC27_08615, partial [Methanomethylovorans sp.]|nr:hypothetical protein [Methanomethylovorans sp.]